MQLLFASSNVNKVSEIRSILPAGYTLCSLKDEGFTGELEENGDTLEDNALQKARFVYAAWGKNCFADDSGLEVEALDGAPGVDSAHYSGSRDAVKNRELLLECMTSEENRKARFRTVIAFIMDGKEYLFEGVLKGTIAHESRGENGFGYDPVFIPDGYDTTLGELSPEVKLSISHRSKAFNSLMTFLRTHKP